MKLFHCCLFIC